MDILKGEFPQQVFTNPGLIFQGIGKIIGFRGTAKAEEIKG